MDEQILGPQILNRSWPSASGGEAAKPVTLTRILQCVQQIQSLTSGSSTSHENAFHRLQALEMGWPSSALLRTSGSSTWERVLLSQSKLVIKLVQRRC